MLVLNNLSCGYSGLENPVVNPVSMQLEAGQFVSVIGRNGAGKSTLMRTIAGLQDALSGEAILNNKPIAQMQASERARLISVVTTEKVSSPGMRVNDVVELGRQPFTDWNGNLSADDQKQVQNAYDLTNTISYRDKPLNSLSDGQRQRIMIARAIAQTPVLMILDEITAFLDLPSRVEVMAMLRRYARENQAIILLSSHDLELSLELADTVWLVDQATVIEGCPEDIINSGEIETAFDNHEVKFDPLARRFKLCS